MLDDIAGTIKSRVVRCSHADGLASFSFYTRNVNLQFPDYD